MPQAWATGALATNSWAEGAWAQAGNVPVITTGAPPGGAQNVGYAFTFRASGDAPITWDLSLGALPTGLSLSAGGVLSGTPTGVESQTFTVRATNTQGTDTEEYTLAIGTAATGGEAGSRARSPGRGLLRLVGR